MQSFEFTRNFDAEIEAEGAAPGGEYATPSRPALSEAEIEALRAEAFAAGRAEGFAAGEAEARARMAAETGTQLAETLATLLPELTALREGRARHHARLESDLIGLVQALAQRILPEVFTGFAPERITEFCRRALRMAEGSGGLELRLAPALLPEVSAALSGALTAEGAPVRLIADPGLTPGMARASWDQGRADYAEEALHQALLTILATLKPSTPSTPPSLPTGADL